jgi:hypothetical protein
MPREYEMEFDDDHVALIRRYPDGNVRQMMTMPWTEVPNLIASLHSARRHLTDHPDHGVSSPTAE